jgi:hypothetical protein
MNQYPSLLGGASARFGIDKSQLLCPHLTDKFLTISNTSYFRASQSLYFEPGLELSHAERL